MPSQAQLDANRLNSQKIHRPQGNGRPQVIKIRKRRSEWTVGLWQTKRKAEGTRAPSSPAAQTRAKAHK